MTERKRRTVRHLISNIKARVDRDVELLNKQSSEVNQMRGQIGMLKGMLIETQSKHDSTNTELQLALESYRDLGARVMAMRDLLKDFEKNGEAQ